MTSAKAHQIASLPPVGSLFAAFLGYNPMQKLLGSASKAGVSSAQFHAITSKIIMDECLAGGKSAAACGKLVA